MNNDPELKDLPSTAAIAEALKTLASSGQFRTLKLVTSPAYQPNFPVERVKHDVVAIVDCEATDGSPITARPIELGICKVAVSKQTGFIDAYLDRLSMLEDPGVPSEPGAQAAHCIPPEELRWKTFNVDQIEQFMVGVDYCVAHNASFDRPVLLRRLRLFESIRWACSMREVDWNSKGCSSRALDYLLYKADMAHAAHRALADAEALAALISHSFDGQVPLLELRAAAGAHMHCVLATGAEFDAKQVMKERGYRWNPGDGSEGTYKVKCWSSPTLLSDEALHAEVKWLAENAYLRRNWAQKVLLAMTTGLMRHTLAVKDESLKAATSMSVGAAMDPSSAPTALDVPRG